MQLRPATLHDAAGVADLLTARHPDQPVGAVLTRFWWTHPNEGHRSMRMVAEREGAIGVFIEAEHDGWKPDERRFGWVQASIHPDEWALPRYREGIAVAESWLLTEQAEVAVAEIRADVEREVTALSDLGYREERRERYWELDLVARRGELEAAAEKSRVDMQRQGIELLTLDRDDNPRTLHQLYELDLAATADIPTSVPIRMSGFDTWYRNYFENPGIRKDRFWIARLGDDVIGMSLIEYPPDRGVPATEFTGTSPRYRGRGIARALKYETVAQAMDLGATRIRTDNDSANAPILHLNEEMGYQPITPFIELHRRL